MARETDTCPQINPATGQLYPDSEPLHTLKLFRQHHRWTVDRCCGSVDMLFRSHQLIRRAVGDSPVFGMHYSLTKQGQGLENQLEWCHVCVYPGRVRLGDRVYVRGQGRLTDQGLESWWSRLLAVFVTPQ